MPVPGHISTTDDGDSDNNDRDMPISADNSINAGNDEIRAEITSEDKLVEENPSDENDESEEPPAESEMADDVDAGSNNEQTENNTISPVAAADSTISNAVDEDIDQPGNNADEESAGEINHQPSNAVPTVSHRPVSAIGVSVDVIRDMVKAGGLFSGINLPSLDSSRKRPTSDVKNISDYPKDDPNWVPPGHNRAPSKFKQQQVAPVQAGIVSAKNDHHRSSSSSLQHRNNPGTSRKARTTPIHPILPAGPPSDDPDKDPDWESQSATAARRPEKRTGKGAAQTNQKMAGNAAAKAPLINPSPVKPAPVPSQSIAVKFNQDSPVADSEEPFETGYNQAADDEFWEEMPEPFDSPQQQPAAIPQFSPEFLAAVFSCGMKKFKPFNAAPDTENSFEDSSDSSTNETLKKLSDQMKRFESGMNEFAAFQQAQFAVLTQQIARANRQNVRDFHFQTLDPNNLKLADSMINDYFVPFPFVAWKNIQVTDEILQDNWIMLAYVKILSQSVRGFSVNEVVRQMCELLFTDELLMRINFAFSKPRRLTSVSRYKYKIFVRDLHNFMNFLYRE